VAEVFNHHASSASLPIPKESVPYRIETEDFETEDRRQKMKKRLLLSLHKTWSGTL
jgi:hypothetical protein